MFTRSESHERLCSALDESSSAADRKSMKAPVKVKHYEGSSEHLECSGDEPKPKARKKSDSPALRRWDPVTGVDHAWDKAIHHAATNSSDGTLLSWRFWRQVPCGTKRPPLDKRVRSKWTKKFLKKLEAKAIENHDEFKAVSYTHLTLPTSVTV